MFANRNSGGGGAAGSALDEDEPGKSQETANVGTSCLSLIRICCWVRKENLSLKFFTLSAKVSPEKRRMILQKLFCSYLSYLHHFHASQWQT